MLKNDHRSDMTGL